jgi:hypothetical protein
MSAMRRSVLFCLLFLCSSLALAHGHPVAVADDHPDAPRLKLCNRAEDVALQALGDRDKGRPLRPLPADEAHTAFLQALARQVYAEPQIRSPKFAQSLARGRCNEYWDSRGEGTAGRP